MGLWNIAKCIVPASIFKTFFYIPEAKIIIFIKYIVV